MQDLVLTEAWKRAYPGAAVGVLSMRGVANPSHHLGLERRKADLERELRQRYAGYDRAALKQLPTLQAYAAYYRRFKKSYHVRLQLESLVFRSKPIPRVAALVETMFMAELDHLLLTAGHDLDVVQPPVRIDVAAGDERYVRLDGREQRLKARDMYIADAQGVLSSIIYGPDQRTQIAPWTRHALFTVYVPDGISAQAVCAHLQGIRNCALIVAPGAEVELLAVYAAADDK